MSPAPPPVPIPQIPHWTQQLTAISQQVLEFCPEFPRIAARYEAWWAHGFIDRPVVYSGWNTNPSRPVNRRLELLHEPQRWLQTKRQDMLQARRIGDALPAIRVDFGPVLLGGMLGGKIEFLADTTWTHAFINDDWSNAPDWTLREDGWAWRQLQLLLELVAQDAAGRYLVCTPDLGGSADVLLNLRGTTGLCLDVIERPQTVRAAIAAIYPSWRKAFCSLYEKTLKHHAGIMHWLGVWSNRPYMVPACDFNFMIGGAEFERICLPDIARQAATAGRAVFHLDGPGAARHIDALLEVDELDAIQFTPGAGNPSALGWIEMFRKIQKRGKSVLVSCPADEAEELFEQLEPEGLAVGIHMASSEAQLDGIMTGLSRRYGGS